MEKLTACQSDDNFQPSGFPSSVPTELSPFMYFPSKTKPQPILGLKKNKILRVIFQKNITEHQKVCLS